MASNFNDYDGGAVGFSGTENTPRSVAECSISTVEITSFDQSSQTVDTQNIEVQTDEERRPTSSEYDEEALLKFLRRMAPRVENELRKTNKYFGADYAEKLSKDDEVATKQLYCLSKTESVKDHKVSHIAWNCYCNKIAIAFNRKADGQNRIYSSYILIYECDNNDEFKSSPKDCLEVESQITGLKFHFSLSSVFVYTTEHCRLYWHDINENVENNSKNFIELIASAVKLSWVNVDTILYLAIAAFDGRLYLISAESIPDERLIYRIFVFEENTDDNCRRIQCFDFSCLNTNKFVVALSAGLLVNCSVNLARPIDLSEHIYNPVTSSFECPKAVVNDIRYSHFESNVFVTSASDQYLRIYQTNVSSPCYVIAIEYIPLTVEWSHLQENIIKTWSCSGELKFYNFCHCKMVKCLKFDDAIDATASSVRGMKELIAIGNSERISIWQTSLLVS